MTLSQLTINEKAVIKSIAKDCPTEIHQRFLDLGFIKGAQIEVHNYNPLGDPTAYLIFNSVIALRKSDADYILIELL